VAGTEAGRETPAVGNVRWQVCKTEQTGIRTTEAWSLVSARERYACDSTLAVSSTSEGGKAEFDAIHSERDEDDIRSPFAKWRAGKCPAVVDTTVTTRYSAQM
jgi:hypothetical protein